MFAELFSGLTLLFEWPTPLYLLGGVVFGLWLGMVPGIGGITGMIILLPFTFNMEPAAALCMLLGLLAVTQTSDTISSVLLGVPGTVAAQATVLDGHPMAKQGLAQTALGAAFTVSAFGGIVGAIALAASLPILTWLVLSFGSPEFFFIATIGLIMVGAVSGSAVAKGIAAATVGLAISQIGYPVTSSVPRYWFGQPFLLDGLPLVPFVIGLFGIPEMMNLAARGRSIAPAELRHETGDSIWAGIKEAYRHKWIALRCSILGTYIGVIPGLGASVVDWLAYGHVVQNAKDKSKFGNGDIRGVIAPESANNAVLGGSLIPTISFGIPGSGAMAVFLGAFTIHGIVPGQKMLTEHLDTTFSMIWALILANLVGAAALMVWSKQVTKAAYVNGHFIVPLVITFLVMGSWLVEPAIPILITLLVAGLIGYFMKMAGWPRPPLLLGFVLGPMMEESLSITVQSYSFAAVAQRPTVIVLAVLLVAITIGAIRSVMKKQNNYRVEQGEESRGSLQLSLALAMLAAGMFAYGFLAARDWMLLSKLSPMVFSAAGFVAALAVIVRDWRKLALPAAPAVETDGNTAGFFRGMGPELRVFALFVALVAAMPVLGQGPAIVIFTAFYLAVWGRFDWKVVAVYSACVAALLYLLYHRVLHTAFLPSMFWN